MSNRQLLWQLYSKKEWGNRPSAFLGLDATSYEAYCFDEAVDYFGREVEAAMHAVKGKNERVNAGRRENVLRKFLGLEQRFAPVRAEVVRPSKDEVEPNFKME